MSDFKDPPNSISARAVFNGPTFKGREVPVKV